MNWTRKRVRGRTSKTFKRWISGCGAYRIEWRGEYEPGRWYATVDVGWMWILPASEVLTEHSLRPSRRRSITGVVGKGISLGIALAELS